MSDWTSCPCCDGDGGMTSGSYPDHEVRGGQYRATSNALIPHTCPYCGGLHYAKPFPATGQYATPAPLDVPPPLPPANPSLMGTDYERAKPLATLLPTAEDYQRADDALDVLHADVERMKSRRPATPAPLDVREWAKAVVRSVPPVHIENTDAVPTFKRRPDQCIDRAAVLLALEHATPAPLDVPVRGALARAWKRRAKMYRGLWSRQLREFHDWRTALRAAGISEMVDMNPDAIRLTVTVPREKRINEMVEERIAAIALATPAPLDVLVAAKVPEDPDSVMAWALLGVGAFTVKDDSGEVCTMVLGSRNNVAARLDNWFAHHPDFDLVLPAPLGRCEVCHWVGGQEERP